MILLLLVDKDFCLFIKIVFVFRLKDMVSILVFFWQKCPYKEMLAALWKKCFCIKFRSIDMKTVWIDFFGTKVVFFFKLSILQSDYFLLNQVNNFTLVNIWWLIKKVSNQTPLCFQIEKTSTKIIGDIKTA